MPKQSPSLAPNVLSNISEAGEIADSEKAKESSVSHAFSTRSLNSNKLVLLSTALINIWSPLNNKYVLIRALLDNGSQSNYLNSDTCFDLGLKREKINISVSGLGENKMNVKWKATSLICNKDLSFSSQVELLIVPRITGLIPSTPIKISEHLIPDRALLADPNFEIPSKINMIIGAELFYDILKEGKTRVSPNLLFQNSAFGLIATGKVHENILNSFCGLTHNSENIEDSLQRFWEIESVSSDMLTGEEEYCENHFLKTHYRNECGRYVVQMPLKKDPQCLGDSKKLALKRLNNIY
nr:uncharacterized protein LOC122273550 [Parasteatoda tepidariorum]